MLNGCCIHFVHCLKIFTTQCISKYKYMVRGVNTFVNVNIKLIALRLSSYKDKRLNRLKYVNL